MFGRKNRQARRERRYLDSLIHSSVAYCSPTRSSGLTYERRRQLRDDLHILARAQRMRQEEEWREQERRAHEERLAWLEEQREIERVKREVEILQQQVAEPVAVSVPPKVWAEMETVEPGDVYV